MKKFVAILVLAALVVGPVVGMISTFGLAFTLMTFAVIAGIVVVAGIVAWAVLALMGEV